MNLISTRTKNDEELKRKILHNIKSKKLLPLAAQTRILYCLANNIPDAVDISIELFCSNNKEAEHHKNTAV